jgi:tRNA pseudouridine55 synthase
VFGLLLLDKPRGMSSNRALQRVKRLFGAAKAGHTGSLDPLATGMLPILFGAATRLASCMLEAPKTYRVVATLGSATSTGDAEGEMIEDRSHERAPAPATIEAVVRRFVGEVEQVPPMYSALKRDGVPLYRLARSGVEVAREPRRVVIEELSIERYDWPALQLRVQCSKGTYVRTLVEDLAKAAGTLGHVAMLRRLAVGPFAEDRLRTFEQLEAVAAEGVQSLDELLIPADAALPGWASAVVSPSDAARLVQGQAVPANPAWACGRVKIYTESGGFIAIGAVTAERRLTPTRVFIR